MTTTSFQLSTGNFAQDWSNSGLISSDDNWDGVASIVGYRGDDLVTATGVDPRTIVSAAGSATVVDVIANQTNPTTLNTGGVAEFALANPTIALNGSGTADAPSIVLYLDATGRENIRFQANLRDLDGSVDNAAQPIAVQYRVAGGNWVNAAYVADASSGPSLSTLVTPVDVILGADANNAGALEIRIITTNAVGNDEWIGVDDILVSSSPAGADTTAPTLAAFNPADPDDGAVAVDPAGDIVLRFSETVVAGNGNFTLSNGTDVRTFSVTDGQVSISGSTLTIDPVTDLVAGTTYTLTADAGIVEDAAGNDFAGLPAGALDFTIGNPTAPLTIGEIQGLGHSSAYVGTTVRTQGVVTAIDSNGYYIQSATGATDGDVRTSDGIFVFTNAAPTGIVVGNLVQIDGTVSEFRPGGVDGANNLTITQIVSPTVSVLGTAAFDSIVVGTGGLVPPTEIIDNDGFSVYDPAQDGIDFYEALEGMLITVDTPLVVGGPNSFGEVFVVASNGVGATGLSERGALVISEGDYNPEKIQLDADTGLFGGFDGGAYSVGDQLASVKGVVNYAFGAYEVLVTEAVTTVVDKTLVDEVTTLTGGADRITFGDYNLENIDPTDPQSKFDQLAFDIVNNLGSPDILGAQEIQDADGAGNGADLSGAATAAKLIAAIVAQGGPTYKYVEVAPTAAGTSGGEPGGNIRNGYFYNDDRVDYVEGSAAIIDGSAFAASRKPLVAQFEFNGETITAINVHSSSRGGSDSLFGNVQPPANGAEGARNAQAAAIRAYVDGLLAVDPAAKIVVQGDFNGFSYETALQSLTAGGALTDLNTLLPANERYSYMFDGNGQQLDHILVSASLLPSAQFDPVHLNAEKPAAQQTETDHDPAVASLVIAVANAAPVANDDAVNVAEDAATANLVAALLGNDTDANLGDLLTIVAVGTAGTLGTVQFDQATQSLVYIADNSAFDPLNPGQTAADSFTYTIRDSSGLESTATVNVTVDGVAEASINGTEMRDRIDGTVSDDIINGLGGNDLLRGLGGNDTIDGGAGTDTIQGGAGTNYLYGGAGYDLFAGEAVSGIHIIDGGAGSDAFQVNSAGARVVVDLAAGTVVGGYSDGSTLTSIEVVKVVGAPNGVEVYGAEVANRLNGSTVADVLDGRGGKDSLLGGLGGDTLTGGAGNDAFIFRPDEIGGDTITDFDGRGALAGDRLIFQGFGPGAFLTNVGTEWSVHYSSRVETFTLNVASLSANDVLFT